MLNEEDEIFIPEDIIREGYSITALLLEELLESPEDLFLIETSNDILMILLEKLDMVKRDYNLDVDILNEILELENDIYSSILKAFKQTFLKDKEYTSLDEKVDSINIRTLATTLYRTFYINKRSILLDYAVDLTIQKRKQYASIYKTSEAKKDLTYQALRNELSLADSDFYVLPMFASEIFNSIIDDNNASIMDYLMHGDLSESEMDLMQDIFSEEDMLEIFNNLKISLRGYGNYPQVRSVYKTLLVDTIRLVAKPKDISNKNSNNDPLTIAQQKYLEECSGAIFSRQ